MALPRAVRTTILWAHLLTGSLVGLVILVMASTGAILAYKRQIVDRADAYHIAPPASIISRASLDVLLANVRTRSPNAAATVMTLRADPAAPASVRLGGTGILFLDPYTGRVLGSGSNQTRAFFQFVEGLHRWLAMSAPLRSVGKGITGVCSVAFLFLVISGFFLWWPRQWNARAIKRVALMDVRLRGKARDFNWHNSIGLWVALPLLFMTMTGIWMSYEWPQRLYSQIAGLPAPSREGEQPAAGREGTGREGRTRRSDGERAGRENERREVPAPRETSAPMELPEGQLDTLWEHARARVPAWKTASFRLPAEGDRVVTFTIDWGIVNRPDQRARIDVNIATGKAKAPKLPPTTFAEQFPLWIKGIHTGEAFGIVGQTIVMLAAIGTTFLVWTGLALMLRRNATWRTRRARKRAGILEPPPALA